MPRIRRQGHISTISIEVPTVLRRGRVMTTAKQRTTTAELIAELNAELRERDPMRIMKQQIRSKTLDDVRLLVSEQRAASDDALVDMYPRIDAILNDLERRVPA